MPMQPSRLGHFSGPLALGPVYEAHSPTFICYSIRHNHCRSMISLPLHLDPVSTCFTQLIDVIQEFCHFGPLVLLISKNIVIVSYSS